MVYREPARKKVVKIRVTLSRGEVNAIVVKHLRDVGRIPKQDLPSFKTRMEALGDGDFRDFIPGARIIPPDTTWELWPGMSFAWDDEVPE